MFYNPNATDVLCNALRRTKMLGVNFEKKSAFCIDTFFLHGRRNRGAQGACAPPPR